MGPGPPRRGGGETRATVPTERGAPRGYPTAWAVLKAPELRARLARVLRASAAGGAAVALGGLLNGCAEPPVCAADRMGEISAHGETAVEDLIGLEGRSAVTEMGVGLGIVPHSVSVAVAGAMPAMIPSLPPTPPSGSGEDPPMLDDDPPPAADPARRARDGSRSSREL